MGATPALADGLQGGLVDGGVRPRRSGGQVAWFGVACVAGLAGLWYFYRGFFDSGFQWLQGDSQDGLFALIDARHWLYLWNSPWPWNQIGTYFPTPDTLAYAEPMFLFGVFQVPMGFIRIPAQLQFQGALLVTSALGYIGALTFLRKGPRVGWPVAIVASLIFVFGNSMYVASYHAQLLILALVPWIGVLLLAAWRSPALAVRLLAAASAGLLLGLITYTSFYIGWFVTLAGAIALACFLLFAALRRVKITRRGSLAARAAAFAAGWAAGLVPVVVTFLPGLRSGSHRKLSSAASFALSPRNLLDVGGDNVVWGRLFHSSLAVVDVNRANHGEQGLSPAPLLVGSVVVLLVWAAVSFRRLAPWGLFGISLQISGLILWVLPVKAGVFFPWAVMYRVPGGSAIRAIGRIELVATAALIFGSAILVCELLRGRSVRTRPILVGLASALLVLLVVEQINLKAEQVLDRDLLWSLDALPDAPASCRSFVLTDAPREPSPRSTKAKTTVQNQAAYVAQTRAIPTWNGYSGTIPPGWDLWVVPGASKAYRAAALRWGQANNLLADGCGLDLNARRWLDPAELRLYLAEG